jgi:two-component system nitrate/nitrite response regulator NarL
MRLRCLIIEDHPVTLLGLRQLIERNFPLSEIVTAETVQEATKILEQASENRFTLAIVEIMLVGHTGNSALLHLKNTLAATSIPYLVFSSINDRRTMDLCKEFGAHGYVSKRTPEISIVRAISTICNGGKFFKMDSPVVDVKSENCLKLTSRQRDVLDLVVAGYSNKKIAGTLELSYGTVKNYMFDLMRLLNVNSRLELAAKCLNDRYSSFAPTTSNTDP